MSYLDQNHYKNAIKLTNMNFHSYDPIWHCAMGVINTYEMLLGENENCKWSYDNGEMWKELDTNDFSIECLVRKGTNQQYIFDTKLIKYV